MASPLRVLFILWCGLTLIPFVSSMAWGEDSQSYPLEEVVVSSTRLPAGGQANIYDIPAKVTVITAEQIRKTGAQTVQEAIQYETGVIMFDGNGNPFQSTVDLRGFNGQPFPSTAVFVDGVRVNEPDTNVMNFDLIPLESIERIEIIPGASSIYGKYALGGVINIITKRGGDRRQATAETVFGSFHRERYMLNSSGPVGKFDYATSFSRETENGYRDESDTRISRYFGKLGFRPAEGTDLTVAYNYTKDRLLVAGTLPPTFLAVNRQLNVTPGAFTDNENNLVSVNGRQQLPFGLSLTVNGFYRHLSQENLTVFYPGFFGFNNDILSKTESKGGTAQVSHEIGGDKLANTFVLGGELTRTDLATRSSPFVDRKSVGEDIFGFFAQDTVEIARTVVLIAGVRYDHDKFSIHDDLNPTSPQTNGTPTFTRTTPRAGIVYKLAPKSSLYFNYADGFRPPNRFELIAQPPFASSLDLRPVRTRSYEVGGKTALWDWGEASLALFQTDVRDEIFFVCTTCVFPDGQNKNVDKTRRRGLESSVRGTVAEKWTISVNYTYTEAHFQSEFVEGVGKVIKIGDSLPLVPKHRLGTTIQFRPVPEWTFALTGLYVSTQVYLNDEPNAFPRLPGYFALNGRIAYERVVPGGKLNMFLQGNNLLNTEYSTFGSIANDFVNTGRNEPFVSPAPTFAVYFGVSYRFEGW
jgi:iron complex outermembrane receptor protein